MQFDYTMPGFFPHFEGLPAIVRTANALIRGQITNNIGPQSIRINQTIIETKKSLIFNEGQYCSSVFELALAFAVRSGNVTLVGSQLANNEEFLRATEGHVFGLLITSRVLYYIPDIIKRYLFGIITRSLTFRTRFDMHACRKTLLGCLVARAAELKETPENRDGENSSTMGEPIDLFQHLYKSSITRKRWSYQEVTGEILLLQLAIILSSTVSITAALIELLSQPEYMQPLREDIYEAVKQHGFTAAACDQMHKLDSFLKESFRMNANQAVALQRIGRGPYKFSDGSSLRSGTPIGVPIICIHRDNAFYPEADRFDGFRFYKLRQQGYQGISVTDVSPKFLTFGYGYRACPGRWTAGVLMKLVFAHILLDYDISAPGELKHPFPERWSFEEFYFPRDAKIVLRPRLQEQEI
jgi:hypothetical protein